MNPDELAKVHAVRRTRPQVGPLHFFVDVLKPGYFRESASPPKGRGLYVIESWGAGVARARLLLGPDREKWRHEGKSLDDAESAAAQHAMKGVSRPKLKWRRGVGEEGEQQWQASADIPIWGRGHFVLPMKTEDSAEGSGAWFGTDVWGESYRSMHASSKSAVQEFVRRWLAMANRPVRYYRVFPYRSGYENYPPGSMRQEGVAQVLELYYDQPQREYAKQTEKQRRISDAAQFGNITRPVFRWDLKKRKGQWIPEAQPSESAARHNGQFSAGQAFGFFEIVEYTTGPKPKARSLGVWKTPTTEEWRRTSQDPELVEIQWARPAIGQMEIQWTRPEEEVTASADDAADELAAQMIDQVTAELRLAYAEEERTKSVPQLRTVQQLARQEYASTMETLVRTFGGARADHIHLEAQARLEAHLHGHRNKLEHYWPAIFTETRGLPRVVVRALEFGGPATSAYIYEEAMGRARAFAAKQQGFQISPRGWVEFLDDDVRADFIISVSIHNEDETGQAEFGASSRIYEVAAD